MDRKAAPKRFQPCNRQAASIQAARVYREEKTCDGLCLVFLEKKNSQVL